MLKHAARMLATAAILALPLAGARSAFADDKPAAKDDALEGLLEKLDEPKPTESATAEPKKADNQGKPAKTETKPSGDVSTKDQDLDSLLEKLGTSEDKPAAEERSRPGSGPGAEPPMPGQSQDQGKDKKKDPAALSGKARDLDEHLEELTGVRRKKKERKDGEEAGPLSDVIKEMREVEQRLGQPDTGEETRKKQEQIVKRIQTMIEQMQNSGGQSQLRRRRSMQVKGGQQPGGKPGETPGSTGGNAPMTKPQKPTDRHSLVGGKDVWGHLPEELRQEMDNVSREEPLTSREELIRRYYLSVSKKTLTRGE